MLGAHFVRMMERNQAAFGIERVTHKNKRQKERKEKRIRKETMAIPSHRFQSKSQEKKTKQNYYIHACENLNFVKMNSVFHVANRISIIVVFTYYLSLSFYCHCSSISCSKLSW